MERGTPKSLEQAIINGLDEYTSKHKEEKNQNACVKIICDHVKEYIRNKMSVFCGKVYKKLSAETADIFHDMDFFGDRVSEKQTIDFTGMQNKISN